MRQALMAPVLAVGLIGLPVPHASGQGLVGDPPTGPTRAVRADAIVIGRVIALEDKDIPVNDVNYRIAVVRVSETLKGKKKETVRLGFRLQPDAPVEQRFRAIPPHHLQFLVGDDGLFFLAKGPDGKFYTTHGLAAYVPRLNPFFQQEISVAKRVVMMGDHASKYLKSENAEERLLAAALLIQKYRERPTNAKEKPIDAAESKLILKVLAGADWAPRRPLEPRVHPYTLFDQLGVSAKDGWRPPQNAAADELSKAAREWLDKNAETYRIQRNVPSALPGKSASAGQKDNRAEPGH